MSRFLKRHLWAVFLAHQLLIFIVAVTFLTLVRRVTGRTIHGGRDPIGVIDGTVLVALSVGVIVMTRALYRWVKGADAPPLGVALSPRRFMDLIAGVLVGLALTALPYIIALLRGTAAIRDSISTHFDRFTAAGIFLVAFFMLLLQSAMEETANRAFPMRLWEHRSLLFRILIPSLFFAALHLADEQFGFGRFGVLLMAGVIQSLAYALTGNIWLSTGLHVGANLALFSMSGLWHAGAVVSVTGQPSFPNWVTVLLMLVTFGLLVRRHESRAAGPPG